MLIVGILLVIVGSLVYYGGTMIYKKNHQAIMSRGKPQRDDKAYLDLIGGGMLTVKIIGAVLVASGAIFIFFFS